MRQYVMKLRLVDFSLFYKFLVLQQLQVIFSLQQKIFKLKQIEVIFFYFSCIFFFIQKTIFCLISDPATRAVRFISLNFELTFQVFELFRK